MYFKNFLIASALVMAGYGTQAQSNVIEDTLSVKGVCGMCKERIEEAAYGKGVKYVSWDKATDKLAIAYRSDKTSLDDVSARILKAGHQVGDQKPEGAAYGNLPKCCQYEETHKH